MAGDFADDSTQKDDALADAERWGLDAGEIEDLREQLGQRAERGLWSLHVNAFLALQAGVTQWRRRLTFVGDSGTPVERFAGLDYTALKVALDMLGISLKPFEWRQLMVLEWAAAAALNGEPAPAMIEGQA